MLEHCGKRGVASANHTDFVSTCIIINYSNSVKIFCEKNEGRNLSNGAWAQNTRQLFAEQISAKDFKILVHKRRRALPVLNVKRYCYSTFHVGGDQQC